jgi:hypothetical protein
MTTVEQGEVSHYRYDDLSFTGADLVIKNRRIWWWFWVRHEHGTLLLPSRPPPGLPDIDFSKEMVIATILGNQSSGSGPSIQILEINTDEGGDCLHGLIQDNDTPGPADVITNPFHIVRLEMLQASSVVFEHRR